MRRRLLYFAVIGISATLILPSVTQAGQEVICLLAGYEKPADPVLNPDYRDGTDVHGKPVVSADVNGNSIDVLPKIYRFPVTVDVAQSLDLTLPIGTEMDVPVGMIEIYSDGRVLYNGNDLSDRVAGICAKEVTHEIDGDSIVSTAPPINIRGPHTDEIKIQKEEKSTQ